MCVCVCVSTVYRYALACYYNSNRTMYGPTTIATYTVTEKMLFSERPSIVQHSKGFARAHYTLYVHNIIIYYVVRAYVYQIRGKRRLSVHRCTHIVILIVVRANVCTSML